MRRSLATLATACCALLLLLVAGCSGSSTEPDRTLEVTGTVTKDHPAQEAVDMHGVGNLRATLVSLTQTAADGTSGAPTVALYLGLGPAAATCSPTGTFLLSSVGSSVSIGLEKGSYCLRFSEAGVLPEGASLNYAVRLEIAD